jgi:glycosyltransferase involved in cell wall biosynthesis
LGRHVAELAPELAHHGVDIHVITPVGEPTIAQLRGQSIEPDKDWQQGIPDHATVSVEDGVIVHRVIAEHKNKPIDIYTRVSEVNRVLQDYAFQIRVNYGQCGIIHTHDWLTGFSARALRRAWQCPLIATIHATERGRARGNLMNGLQRAIDAAERDLIREADQVVVCSHHMFKELQVFFQVDGSKISVVPNGINLAGLKAREPVDLAAFRARYAAPDEPIVFSVARLVYEKGIHRLIDAVRPILANCPNVKFVIAGKGPETINLKQRAAAMGLGDDIVKFIGFIPDEDKDRLLEVADCAVFPSLYEPFGIVALEAMALGCPVVVSEVGGLAEVVTHEQNGITVYPDNSESIAWGVVHTLTNVEQTAKQVANGKKWVEENFTWNRIAGQTKDVYQQVCHSHKKTI